MTIRETKSKVSKGLEAAIEASTNYWVLALDRRLRKKIEASMKTLPASGLVGSAQLHRAFGPDRP